MNINFKILAEIEGEYPMQSYDGVVNIKQVGHAPFKTEVRISLKDMMLTVRIDTNELKECVAKLKDAP
jgi:hypothetical protein